MRALLFGLVLLGLSPTLLPACKKAASLTEVSDSKFKVGQRWSYWARPGEEQSTFTIVKIESHPQVGVIVHVGLDNLQLKQGSKTTGLIPHLAFSREAIERSAAKLVDEEAPLPNFKQGYADWRKAVDEGQIAVRTAPIAETLNSMESQ
jgi:hypothetical protein